MKEGGGGNREVERRRKGGRGAAVLGVVPVRHACWASHTNRPDPNCDGAEKSACGRARTRPVAAPASSCKHRDRPWRAKDGRSRARDSTPVGGGGGRSS